jgi:hypothetical protein
LKGRGEFVKPCDRTLIRVIVIWASVLITIVALRLTATKPALTLDAKLCAQITETHDWCAEAFDKKTLAGR